MTRTRSHLVVSSAQVRSGRLRPSQGGAFHAPVGPPADHPAREPEAKGLRFDVGGESFTAINIVYGSCHTPEDTAREIASMQRAIERAQGARRRAGLPDEPAHAAPPVDAELEAERVRLVGKRVRRTEGLTHPIDEMRVARVYRSGEAREICLAVENGSGGWITSCFEPIPEEPRTIHDAKVGDRVEHIASRMIGVVESFDLAWRMVHVNFGHSIMERMPIACLHEFYRLAPPGGRA
jgi:hypothetical protein